MKSHSLRSIFISSLWLVAAFPALAASDYSIPYAFSTVAGDSSIGSSDGPGKEARFYSPRGVAVDRAGNVYVADAVNDTIRKIAPDGTVSTLAGTAGVFGAGFWDQGMTQSVDGLGPKAMFSNPEGIAVDSAGLIYVTDKMDFTIRRVTPEGDVTTWAGGMRKQGSIDGPRLDARFDVASAATFDSAGNLYVSEWNTQTIRKITPAGVVSTLAGKSGVFGSADGTGSEARFFQPMGLTTDADGAVYVADAVNNTIRKITPAGVVTTIAGKAGLQGVTDGPAGDARFVRPCGIVRDAAGNFYIADTGNATIRKMSAAGVVTTIAGKAGVQGSTDGAGPDARFRSPASLAIDAAGALYVADQQDNTIRKISPEGKVTTLAGLGLDYAFGNNDGLNSPFEQLGTTAVGPAGEIYVADSLNATIRKVAPDGMVTTLAGKAGQHGAVDGTGSEARFQEPYGVAVDATGTVYVSDPGNDTIRKITAAGIVTTLAGSATAGADYADGTGASARFAYPFGLTLGSDGALYVADTDNYSIRRITPAGEVTTLAGRLGTAGSADGTGVAARFRGPTGIAADAAGNLFVTDTPSQTIRKITPAGIVTTLAGKAGESGSDDGDAAAARFFAPTGIAVDAAGTVFVTDATNQLIRQISATGKVSTLGGLVRTDGYADGLGVKSRFQSPPGLALGAKGKLYITSGAILRLGQAAAAAVITTQPKSQAVETSGSARFSVAAEGVPAPTFQWRLNGNAITGATNSTLTLAAARNADAGDYTVIATNALGSATSDKATLTVNPAPVVTPPTPTPAPSAGSGGGGAPSEWFVLALLALGLVRACRRSHAA